MLETLDYTIRIGSTPTFLYFDLYIKTIYIYTIYYILYTIYYILYIYILYTIYYILYIYIYIYRLYRLYIYKDYSLYSIVWFGELYLVFICDIKKNHVCSEVVGRPSPYSLLATFYRFSTK